MAELKQVPGTSVFMYADDTATLCSGGTISEARERAQQAADVMARWSREWNSVCLATDAGAVAVAAL